MNIITIENKVGKIRLNETVTKDSIGRMIDEIGKLFGATASAEGADFGTIMNAAENAVDTLDIEINSPGGSVFDGYTIYNEIGSLRARGVVVNARITGMAASMASVIAMACDKVVIASHGRMMIHDASSGVSGNAETLRKTADLLDSISADIANIYANRTGKPVDDIRALMKKETWMNAETCIAEGFADEQFDIRTASGTTKAMNIFKTLFPSLNDDDADKLKAHIDEAETLRADLVEAETKIAELTNLAAVVADKDIEIANLTAASAAYEAEIVAKGNVITELQDELTVANDAIAAAKESAGSQAIEILAAIGQTEPLPEAHTGVDEPTDILAKYESLKGSEKWAFLANNSIELANAARKKSPTN